MLLSFKWFSQIRFCSRTSNTHTSDNSTRATFVRFSFEPNCCLNHQSSSSSSELCIISCRLLLVNNNFLALGAHAHTWLSTFARGAKVRSLCQTVGELLANSLALWWNASAYLVATHSPLTCAFLSLNSLIIIIRFYMREPRPLGPVVGGRWSSGSAHNNWRSVRRKRAARFALLGPPR